MRLLYLPALLLFAIACNGGGEVADNGGGGPDPTVSFEVDVLPLFEAECFECHGGAAGLFLESYEAVMDGGRSGAAVVPGNSNTSLLIRRLEGTITPRMPLDREPLTQPEIDRIRTWIDEGALDN